MIGSGSGYLQPCVARFSVPARGRPADKQAQIAAVAGKFAGLLLQAAIQGPWRSTSANRRRAKLAKNTPASAEMTQPARR